MSRDVAVLEFAVRGSTCRGKGIMLIELGKQGYRLARRIAIALIGGTVVLIGVVMLVTPGPALVVIPIGLAILAIEFAWARHWLNRLKSSMSKEQLNGLLARGRQFGIRSAKSPPDQAGE